MSAPGSSSGLQPKDVGHAEMPGIAYGVFATGKYAYVVGLEQNEEDEAGLTVFDISDPTAPVRTGFHKMKYGAERIWVENSTEDTGLCRTDLGCGFDRVYREL